MDNIQSGDIHTGEAARVRGLSYKESFRDTFLESLKANLGYYVIAEFCACGEVLDKKDGILYAVGNDYLTLYQEDDDSYTVCGLDFLRFITIFEEKARPRSFRCTRR